MNIDKATMVYFSPTGTTKNILEGIIKGFQVSTVRQIDLTLPIKADQTPAVIVVVYGNRAFEDALLELFQLVKEAGFIPVAAGAFIGEHSYSTAATPIAEMTIPPVKLASGEKHI